MIKHIDASHKNLLTVLRSLLSHRHQIPHHLPLKSIFQIHLKQINHQITVLLLFPDLLRNHKFPWDQCSRYRSLYHIHNWLNISRLELLAHILITIPFWHIQKERLQKYFYNCKASGTEIFHFFRSHGLFHRWTEAIRSFQ